MFKCLADLLRKQGKSLEEKKKKEEEAENQSGSGGVGHGAEAVTACRALSGLD